MTRATLLTVSTAIPADLDAACREGNQPVPDYAAIQQHLPADLIDHRADQASRSLLGRVARTICGPDVALGVAAFQRRHDYSVIITDNERAGFAFAALLRLARLVGRERHADRPRHVMITHVISRPKKRVAVRLLGLDRAIDAFVVYASSQRDFLVSTLGQAPSKVRLIPFTVDTQFFDPTRNPHPPSHTPLVVSVGLEQRDYATLFDAVSQLDVELVVAADSTYGSSGRTTLPEHRPRNVSIVSLDRLGLRALYASATVAVVPLRQNPFQAGVTAMLEALSMARPLVVTRTEGQTDVVIDGRNGRYAEPHDSEDLAKQIQCVLDDPVLAADMGECARAMVENENSLYRYVEHLAAVAEDR